MTIDRSVLERLLGNMTKCVSMLDLCFASLGDPTRRSVLQPLGRRKASVGELSDPHDMLRPSILAHLDKLEAPGLLHSSKPGVPAIVRSRRMLFAPHARGWRSSTIFGKTGLTNLTTMSSRS